MAAMPAIAGASSSRNGTPRRDPGETSCATSRSVASRSGSTILLSTEKSNGISTGPIKAPTTNKGLHPTWDAVSQDSRLAAIPPAGMPPITTEMHSEDIDDEQADRAMAMQTGITTPRPAPASSLVPVKSTESCTEAVHSMAAENTEMPHTSTLRCPYLEFNHPAARPPSSIPMNTAEPATPASAVSIPSVPSLSRKGSRFP